MRIATLIVPMAADLEALQNSFASDLPDDSVPRAVIHQLLRRFIDEIADELPARQADRLIKRLTKVLAEDLAGPAKRRARPKKK